MLVRVFCLFFFVDLRRLIINRLVFWRFFDKSFDIYLLNICWNGVIIWKYINVVFWVYFRLRYKIIKLVNIRGWINDYKYFYYFLVC